MIPTHRIAPATLACAVVAALASIAGGCAGPGVAPAGGQRVENPGLGIALAELPAPFEVETNEGTTLRLRAPGPSGPGIVTFAAGSETDAGINLVEEVKQRKAAFEAEGEYFGNRELGTPIGTAFTARGRLQEAEGGVEEIWVYAIHPGANRLLTVTYRYPVGNDSSERVQQLMALLGEIEAAAAGAPPAAM